MSSESSVSDISSLVTDSDPKLIRASQGQRLANLLIDIIFSTILFSVIEVAFAVINTAFRGSEFQYQEANILSFRFIIEALVSLFFKALLYGILEYTTHGKTVGKFITGTKAVQWNGERITFQQAIMRGFIRMIPFEAISALENPPHPWHDKWTKTIVIDVKASQKENLWLRS